MNVHYINPFISSTIETYKTMLNCIATPGKPILKQAPYTTYDITGNIGLSGSAHGSISLAFKEKAAVDTVSAMLGTTLSADKPEIIDGIGELVNIIAGYAKKDLTEYNLEISLPSVIIGRDVVVTVPSGVSAFIVPFSSRISNFTMEIALETNR